MVSVCIKLYTMNFCNIKNLKRSIRVFINYVLTPAGLPLLLGVHGRRSSPATWHSHGGKPCLTNILFLTPLATTDIFA